MSKRGKERIFPADDSDPRMQQAYEQARATFKYLWRELSWEYRRVIPALNLACVKTRFADKPLAKCGPRDRIEQMWLDNVHFDGETIYGTLLNSPNALRSVKQGDECSFAFEQLTDWMYATDERVYGAYTVQLIRSLMDPAERKAHDAAWGLKFGDPAKVLIVPAAEGKAKRAATKPGKTSRSGNSKDKNPDGSDHPMCINMVPTFKKHLKENPGLANEQDEHGWTLLHRESLAGNTAIVEVLLKAGADRKLKTNAGDTALDLARRMKWDRVVAVLS